MYCCLCGMQEVAFNFFTVQKEPVSLGADVKRITCSNCIQILLASTQEQIKRAYEKTLKIGCTEKAEAIRSFIREEVDNVPKARKTGTRVARKRTLRSIKSANIRKIRAQHPII